MGSNISSFKIEFGLIVVGAIIFTASFLWKDLLMDVQEKYFPREAGLCGRFFFTILITIVLVILAISLKKIWGLENNPTTNPPNNKIEFDDNPLEKNNHNNSIMGHSDHNIEFAHDMGTIH